MIKNLLIAALVLSLAACKSKTAFNYSEDFVKKEQSLGPDMQKAEADVSTYNAAGQYDSIAAIGARMEKLFDIKLKEIEEKPAPDAKEGENFKRAGIQYFKFLKSIYAGYKEYGNAKTPEERQIALSKIKDNLAYKETAIADIKQSQQKFADANGFKIQQ
ncbi:MAG: hypothetical protein JWO92_613 [Chitinophagaceae bacterium]|nr:hypothetical protein [Chitinophagaceae bacterium]